MGATSTVCAGAAADPAPAAAPPPDAVPPAGVALALLPKIALMIFPKILIACSRLTQKSSEGLGRHFRRRHRPARAYEPNRPGCACQCEREVGRSLLGVK